MTRDDRLDEVLRALAAPAPDEDARRVPPELLRAFAQQAAAREQEHGSTRTHGSEHGPESPEPGRDRRQGHGRGHGHRRIGFATKTAVCALVVSGGAVTAAAAADELPRPAQNVAHAMFGPLGVPAPQASSPAPSPGHAAHPNSTPAHGTPAATHVPPGQTHTPATGKGETKKASPAASATPSSSGKGKGKAKGADKGNGSSG